MAIPGSRGRERDNTQSGRILDIVASTGGLVSNWASMGMTLLSSVSVNFDPLVEHRYR